MYIFDQYSLLHFSVGVIAFFFKLSFIKLMILHIIFELIENSKAGMEFINKYLIFIWPGGKNYKDSFINSMIGDNISVSSGWIMAWYLNKLSNKYGISPL